MTNWSPIDVVRAKRDYLRFADQRQAAMATIRASPLRRGCAYGWLVKRTLREREQHASAAG